MSLDRVDMKKIFTLLLLVTALNCRAGGGLNILPLGQFPFLTTVTNTDVMVMLSASNAGPVFSNRNVSVQAFLASPYVTNVIASVAYVISLSNNTSSNFISNFHGIGTNLTLKDASGTYTNGALVVNTYTNNVDGMPIRIIGRGTNSAAGINFFNDTSTMAADFAMWGSAFGPPFTGNVALDLYNFNGISSNDVFGPSFVVHATGKYNTLFSDSGVVAHPIMAWDSTNLQVRFYRGFTDDRYGTWPTVWDVKAGAFKGLQAQSPALVNGSGTMTIGADGAVIGVGTEFTNTFLTNKLFFVGATPYDVIKVTDITHMTVSPGGAQPVGSAYVVYPNAGTVFGTSGPDTSAGFHLNGSALPYVYAGGQSYISFVEASVPSLWKIGNSFGDFFLLNSRSNTGPWFVDKSAGNGSMNINGNGVSMTNGAGVATSFKLSIGTPSAGQVWTATNANGGGAWSNAVNTIQIYNTNAFTSGLLYTNSTGFPMQVIQTIQVTRATIDGWARMDFQVGGTNISTFSVSTTTTNDAGQLTNTLTGFVPNGQTFSFTNTSSGAGNSTTPITTAQVRLN